MLRSLDGIAPRIHPTAFVSEAAYVIGDVEIGEGASVWPGTVIRGDMGRITIGKYTCVQDNSVVHCDTDAVIGDYVVIGHRVVCHAKNVGTRSLLGNGAVVNDGVWIGDECVVASGAVVLDDMQVPAAPSWSAYRRACEARYSHDTWSWGSTSTAFTGSRPSATSETAGWVPDSGAGHILSGASIPISDRHRASATLAASHSRSLALVIPASPSTVEITRHCW